MCVHHYDSAAERKKVEQNALNSVRRKLKRRGVPYTSKDGHITGTKGKTSRFDIYHDGSGIVVKLYRRAGNETLYEEYGINRVGKLFKQRQVVAEVQF